MTSFYSDSNFDFILDFSTFNLEKDCFYILQISFPEEPDNIIQISVKMDEIIILSNDFLQNVTSSKLTSNFDLFKHNDKKTYNIFIKVILDEIINQPNNTELLDKYLNVNKKDFDKKKSTKFSLGILSFLKVKFFKISQILISEPSSPVSSISESQTIIPSTFAIQPERQQSVKIIINDKPSQILEKQFKRHSFEDITKKIKIDNKAWNI